MCKIRRDVDVHEVQENVNHNVNAQSDLKEQDRVINNCVKIEHEGGVQVMGLGPQRVKHVSVEDIHEVEAQQAEVKKCNAKRGLLIVAGVLLLIGAVILGAGIAALTAGAAVAVYAPLLSVGGAFLITGGVMGIVGLCLKNKPKRFSNDQPEE